ncbi:MAG: diphthine--ammonia ligase [Thermoplasmata archaeon]
MTEKVLFTWSGGKDSAMALYELQRTHDYEISALLTTVTEDYDRISMHGVRRILLEQQAESLGIPLEKVYITKNASNDEYEAKMRDMLMEYQSQGVLSVVFGDIFLEDLRKYREENLSKIGMRGIFPIWKRDTAGLAHTFIDLGFKAVITCVDSNVLDKRFAGRLYDKQFLRELPSGVDPCGENGEFHSFVYDGPIFQEKIAVTMGDVVLRDNRFYFCDLILSQKGIPATSDNTGYTVRFANPNCATSSRKLQTPASRYQ